MYIQLVCACNDMNLTGGQAASTFGRPGAGIARCPIAPPQRSRNIAIADVRAVFAFGLVHGPAAVERAVELDLLNQQGPEECRESEDAHLTAALGLTGREFLE